MGLANVLTTVFDMAGAMSKKPISSFNYIETLDDEHTLVAKDGSLMTLVKVDGVKQVQGEEELTRLIEVLNQKLSTYLGRPGFAIQVWFCRDPDLSLTMLKEQMLPSRNTAKQLRLDLSDVFDEREKHLAKHVVYESYHIALWTRLTVMTRQERQRAEGESKAPKFWPKMFDAQNMFRSVRQLRDRHRSFVTNFIQDLKEVSIRANAMTSHDAIRAMKWAVYPDLIGADWRPTLVGDPTMARRPEVGAGDASHLLWPRVDDQLFHQEAERVNPRIVRVGSRYFAGIDMIIGPQEVTSFTALLDRMINIGEFPWRVSFTIEGDGLGGLGLKSFLASIFQLTNSENRVIRDAIKDLQEARLHGSIVTRLRISFATWGPSDDLRLIEDRSSRLQRSIESWGYCVVSATAGDPLAGVMSSALGLDVASTAPPGAAPLADVISMLPWDRDASPWQRGSIMFKTPDGRIWPYQPGSSAQDAFVDIIFAPPGKGKSVYLNTANLALCLSPGAVRGLGGSKLPRLSIIDIGPSSSGLISLLKDALPPDRRHEAQYFRLNNKREHAINPFDTQIGCRRPSPIERAFLVNFLTALGTPAGKKDAPSGLAEIAGFCVDALYELLDDRYPKSQPRKYEEQRDLEVDAALVRHNINLQPMAPWWHVVDELFKAGDVHSATMAQRQAVPRLEDLGLVLNEGRIKDIHKTAHEGQEATLSAFMRAYISALKEYPILSSPTQFDIGDSRVVAMDLDEVAPRGTGPAEKQTALMYMLARFVLARDFYMTKDLLETMEGGKPLIPDLYRDFQASRIRRLREVPKRLVYDEFHRTSSSPAVRAQVLVDIREGRKWGVHIALASQLLDDFDEAMVDMASGIWIMGAGNDRGAEECARIFGLSDTATYIVKRHLNGPGPGGAPFLCVLMLKEGRHEHLLYNTLAPIEIWAFSTTAEDASLRNLCYERLGAVTARKLLAKKYPSGSAKLDIERRNRIKGERGEQVSDNNDGVIDEILQEIVTMSHH
jgi:intracellular multiplication protein IcmB